MDEFAGDLVRAVEERNEPTVLVFYGDHLPTMKSEAKDLKSRISVQYKLCYMG